MKKKLEVVAVTWIDSYHSGGWRGSDELPPIDHEVISECLSVGFLVERGKKFIRLALSNDYPSQPGVGRYGHFISIPRVAVKKIKKVRI